MLTTFHKMPKIALRFGSIFFTKNNFFFDKAYKIIALSLFVFAFSISSSAATYTVDTTTDGNDKNTNNAICASGINNVCTLRAAVQQANARVGDDTIVFAPALAGQTIRLSSLIGNDIDITSNIVIDATGVNGITVASDNLVGLTSRIFRIGTATGASLTVTMNNFRIAEGRLLIGTLGGGGGIIAGNTNLTLNNMTVQNNGVLVTGSGGGIYVAGGTLNLNNSVVDSNFATLSTSGGGGVFATTGAVVNINNSTISNNSALVDGGGILNTGGSTLNLTESTVSGNFALGLGGGVANRAVALVVTRATIRRSLISGNTPFLGVVGTLGGGAVSNVGTDVISDAVMTIANSTITNNSATAEGGGISNILGDMHLTNNTISHNNSTVGGGGVASVAVGPLLGNTYMRNNIIAQNNDLLGTNIVGTDALGIFNSLGNNLIGSNFSVEVSFAASAFVGVTPQPNVNADLVGSVAVGNQIIDPLLGPLQNNGGPTFTRAITNLSPAFNRANSCVFDNTCTTNPQGLNPPFALATDQRSTGFTRFSGSAVDIGAFEIQLAPTAAGIQIAGRVVAGKRGVSKAFVYIKDFAGNTQMTMTNQFGYYKFNDVPTGKTYVFEVKSKQYYFNPQALYLTEEMLDLNFTSLNVGISELSSFK